MKLFLSGNNWGNTSNISFKTKNDSAFTANVKLKSAPVADSFNGKTLNILPQKVSFGDAVEIFFGRRNKKDEAVKTNKSESKTPYVRPEFDYNNKFVKKLTANINPELKAVLACDKSIHDIDRAYTRVSSLSTYLKEQMVGFITPDKDHWFEKAMPYILKGSQAKDLKVKDYCKAATEFWGLMAKADNYWKSEAFIDYLGSMKQTPAIKATLDAVIDLHLESAEMSYKMVAFAGYPSKIKYIPELLEKCAYTGVKMDWDGDEEHRPSAEHILPHSVLGDELNIDVNYLVASAKVNSDRGSLPLMLFLKGWNQNEYLQQQEYSSKLKLVN